MRSQGVAIHFDSVATCSAGVAKQSVGAEIQSACIAIQFEGSEMHSVCVVNQSEDAAIQIDDKEIHLIVLEIELLELRKGFM